MLNPRIKVKNQILIFYLFLAAVIVIASACRLSPPSTPTETAQTESPPKVAESTPSSKPSPTTTQIATAADLPNAQHRQWAISAVDQKGADEALYAIGAPDSEGCDLSPRESVWVYQSDSFLDTSNYLQLFFAAPVLPSLVNIHLAYTHSAITGVSLIDLQGQAHEIYEGLPHALTECPMEFTIQAKAVSVPVYAVRINLATLDDEVFGLTAIDAVELVGEPLTEAQATPIPTPYLTMSSLGFNASDVPKGAVHFEVFDHNTGERISVTECDAFSYNVMETEQTLRFFSCEDATEIWLYMPLSLEIGSLPLNTYPQTPSARLFYVGKFIPAMEGECWVDWISETHMTGVLEFKGFDPQNQVDYYRVVAIFNQIPLTEEAARKPGEMIVQWAQGADASSEWSGDDNAAHQAVGPSDTWLDCETALTTWKPELNDPQPWLELTYQTSVEPTVLNILFSGPPETIREVNLLSAADSFPLDLSTARLLEGCPQALAFDPITLPPIEILAVQILLDPAAVSQDFGVDAVQLIGVTGE